MFTFNINLISKKTIFKAGVFLYACILAGLLISRFFFGYTEFRIELESESSSQVSLVYDKGYRLSYVRKKFFANFQRSLLFFYNGRKTPSEKLSVNFEKIRHFAEETYPEDFSDIRDYAITRIVIAENLKQIVLSGPEILKYYSLRDMRLLKTDGGKIVLQTCGMHPELVPKAEQFARLVPEFSKERCFSFLLSSVLISIAVILLFYGLVFHFEFLRGTVERLWSPVRRFYTRRPRISALILLSGMVLAFLPGTSDRAFCHFSSTDRANSDANVFLVRGSNFSALEFQLPAEAAKNNGGLALELYEKGNPDPVRKCVLPESKWKDTPSVEWEFFPVFESRNREFSLKITLPSSRNIILKEAPIATFLLIFNHAVIIGMLGIVSALTWIAERLNEKRKKSREEKKPEMIVPPKRRFDYAMHYFRAFAIICIVLSHYFHSDLSFAIFNCSTIFFLFISGYLLVYLDRNRFRTGTFYRKKFLNVLLPYILIAGLVYLYQMRNVDVSSTFWYYRNLPLEILLGYRICVQFWYIPFIAIVFLFTPFLMKMPRSWLINITLVSLFVPLYAVRRDFFTGVANTLEVFAFFVPVYLAGMSYALEKEKIDLFLRKYILHMIVMAFGLTVFLFFRNANASVNTAALYVQKLAFTGIAIVVLTRISHKKIKILDLFAKYSFAIYFTHVFFGDPLIAFFANYFSLTGIPDNKTFISFISIICTLFTVLFICVLLKMTTGRYSRNLFGG